MARKAASVGVKKTQAYREAATALGEEADLDAVQKYILEKFQIDMTKQQISQYRSNEKRRAGSNSTAGRSRRSATSGDAILEFVSSVRDWEDRLGAEKICEVISALYKKN